MRNCCLHTRYPDGSLAYVTTYYLLAGKYRYDGLRLFVEKFKVI